MDLWRERERKCASYLASKPDSWYTENNNVAEVSAEYDMYDRRKTVEERILNALNNHKKGYNCSQSVACAFCDLVGVDEDTMFRMMEAYGFGMGNAEGTCGAMSGAIAVLGMKNSTGCEKIGSKKDSYAKAKVMMEKFAEKNSSVICKELKGLTGGPVLRTCDGCIEDAARLVAEYLTAQN